MRWVCPLCQKGRLAPKSIRNDDVRRYCLPCSEKTGRLVQREIPSLVKKNEARAARRAEKLAAKRARIADKKQRAARDREAYPWNLEALRTAWGHLATWECNLSKIPLKIRRGTSQRTSGRAWSSGRMCVTAGLDAKYGYMVLLHEMAHIAGWYRPKASQFRHHSVEYKSCLRSAAKELLGVEIGGKTVYEVDEEIAKAFQVWIDAGKLPAYIPPPPRKSRKARPLTDEKGVLTIRLDQASRDELREVICRWTQFDSQTECQEPGDEPGRWGKIATWIAGMSTNTGMEIHTREMTKQQRADLHMFAGDMASTGKNLSLKDLRRAGKRIRLVLSEISVQEIIKNRLLTNTTT